LSKPSVTERSPEYREHPIPVTIGSPQVTGCGPGAHVEDSTGPGMLTISA